jgi:predicted O-methyltransferase YrrM
MYSSFQLAKKYLQYYVGAKNGKGHGIHSPFVFDFVTHVLNNIHTDRCYDTIEVLRRQLLTNNATIQVEDYGAGSAVIPARKRTVRAIAKSSLKNKKFARLLFRMVQYYKPDTIIELGTSLGITTCYLACAHKGSMVYTFEGAASIADIAEQNFKKAGLQNVTLVRGKFEETFQGILAGIKNADFAFVDGNHRKTATLNYFYMLQNKSAPGSIFIFDDIHWSPEMEEAWQQIQDDPSVTVTIDLFFMGIVFFNPDFKAKQNFTIRF